MRLKPDPFPTLIGAALVGWNLTHWRKGPHVSGLASKHPVITTSLVAYYWWHFLGNRVLARRALRKAVNA